VVGGAIASRSTAQPKAKRYTVPDGTDATAEERAEEQLDGAAFETNISRHH